MRERGLKRSYLDGLARLRSVAPHAGAWIEALHKIMIIGSMIVAPHAGAWIEAAIDTVAVNTYNVAPHAGAWIEA